MKPELLLKAFTSRPEKGGLAWAMPFKIAARVFFCYGLKKAWAPRKYVFRGKYGQTESSNSGLARLGNLEEKKRNINYLV